jgi:hypothetical protein
LPFSDGGPKGDLKIGLGESLGEDLGEEGISGSRRACADVGRGWIRFEEHVLLLVFSHGELGMEELCRI